MALPYKYNNIFVKIDQSQNAKRNIKFKVKFVSKGLEGVTNVDEPGGIHQILDSNEKIIGKAEDLIGTTCFANSELAFLPKPNTPEEDETEIEVEYYLDNKLLTKHLNTLVDEGDEVANPTPTVILVFKIEEEVQ